MKHAIMTSILVALLWVFAALALGALIAGAAGAALIALFVEIFLAVLLLERVDVPHPRDWGL